MIDSREWIKIGITLLMSVAIALVVALFIGKAWAQPFNAGPSTGTFYPSNASPVNCSANGTTGAVSCSLPGAQSRWTFLCGFVVTSGGTTAAADVLFAITGTQNTLNFSYMGVSSGQGLLGVAFPHCQPASAVNQAITASLPALGAGTINAAVVAWGYQLPQ
jgi:hypothetical protein